MAERELLLALAATTYPTLPVPVPEAAVLKVTQLTGLCAVHAHVVPAVTAIVPEPAEAVIDALAGEMLYPHPAACVTVTAWPATVSTPARDWVVGLATKEYVTLPEPEPLAPPVTVIHETELEALQPHPAGEVTVTVPVPALAAAAAVVGATV